ncbi:MAG: DUF4167 domain-containing protein [Sphingomicrobium sp.]
MINNRQGGRRRGRGGQRGQGGQPGNRQDNRQRGNAAQLLEKYKSMARDAQLSGDRVQTEYYLQYADHYFRMLGEGQSRFDNQRRPHDDEDDEGEDEMSEAEAAESDIDDRPEREPRRERSHRNDSDQRPRPRAEQRTEQRAEPSEDRDVEQRPEPVERTERPAPRRRSNGSEDTGMPLSALPPAIGRADESEPGEGADDAPKPRRRSRTARPTAAGDDESAPTT